MAKYLYALEKATDLVVSAESLAGSEVLKKYQCIGCEGELIAKVNGAVMQPHFAHKAAQECSGETYLHKLGKKIFFERPLHKPATYSRHQSQTQLKTGIGVKR